MTLRADKTNASTTMTAGGGGEDAREGECEREGRVGVWAKSRKYALGINDKLPARKSGSMARHGHGPLLLGLA